VVGLLRRRSVGMTRLVGARVGLGTQVVGIRYGEVRAELNSGDVTDAGPLEPVLEEGGLEWPGEAFHREAAQRVSPFPGFD
jgi:hypothetical protein